MLNENMYSVWKIYANRKYIWCFQKYILIEKYIGAVEYCNFIFLSENISWFKNTSSFKRIMGIKNIDIVWKNIC